MSTKQATAPSLPAVQYDQTRQYHPFAKSLTDGEWLVQPPTARNPIGVVRSRVGDDGALQFVVFGWAAGSAAPAPFEGSHPTLFHAVSWLRWRLGARP
jgi:hypothetical protein